MNAKKTCKVCGQSYPRAKFRCRIRHKQVNTCLECRRGERRQRSERNKLRDRKCYHCHQTKPHTDFHKAPRVCVSCWGREQSAEEKRRTLSREYWIWSRIKHQMVKALEKANAGFLIDLGGEFDMDTLHQHLRKFFTPSMQWEDPGSFHVVPHIPYGLFNLSDPEQQMMGFCVLNMRPVVPRDAKKTRRAIPSDRETHLSQLRRYVGSAAVTRGPLPYTGEQWHSTDAYLLPPNTCAGGLTT